MTNILKARQTHDGWRYNLDGEVELDPHQTVTRLHEHHGLQFREAREKMELDDGRTVRLRIEPDQDHSVLDEDEEMFGSFAHVGRRNDYGHYERPDGFDGNAELLGIGRSYDRIWWQPRKDAPRRGTSEFDLERSQIIELLEYGYVGFIIEVWHSCGECSTRHEEASASLWGIESFVDKAYQQEVISDLLAELDIEPITEEVNA